MSVLTAPTAETTVPTWPRIVATVSTSGDGEVIIDEVTHAVPAATPDEARRAMIALVRAHAQHLARPVRMDVSDDGGQQVLIYPDGGAAPAEPGAPATHPRPTDPRPAPVPARQRRAGTDPAPQALVDAEEPAALEDPWLQPLPQSAPPARQSAPAAGAHAGDAAPTAPAALTERAPAPAPVGREQEVPTLAALLEGRAHTRPAPAQQGWRAGLRALTGGAIAPPPGRAELAHRAAAAIIARPLTGPKTVVVVNPKGGAHKTTAALLLAANLGLHRGGSTLAWDNNETRGTMGWRAAQSAHSSTAIDLLAGLQHLTGAGVRVGDLDAYVRAQPWGHFDVLASDEDAASADLVDGKAFEALHATLSRFYRVMVVDTGNNMRAPNWAAALAAADQLVIVSTIREDTSQSAAWLADALRATGHDDLVQNAVTVLTAPARTTDPALGARLHTHFSRLTRAVVSVPHDPALVAGGPIDYAALSPASREAWLRATAAVADGL